MRLFVVPLYILGLAAIGFLTFFLLRTGVYIFVFGFGMVPALVNKLRARGMYGRVHDSVKNLMDLPPTLEQFPVDVAFLYEGTVYGRDVGVVSFADGQMHFEGLRTTFSLPKASLANKQVRRLGNSRTGMKVYRLFWDCPSVYGGELLITPYDSVEGVGSGFRGAFDSQFYAWSESKSYGTTPILPPIRPLAEQIRAYWIANFVILLGSGLTFGMLAYLGVFLGADPSAIAFFLLSAACIWAFVWLRQAHKFRVLRRLGRGGIREARSGLKRSQSGWAEI